MAFPFAAQNNPAALSLSTPTVRAAFIADDCAESMGTKRELKPEMFSFETAVPVTYNSAEQKPDIELNDKNDGKDILALSDVTFTYTNNVHAGTATVTIDAKDDGNYTGKVEMTFVINPAQVTIKAKDADSVYGQDIADVSELYEVTGTIYEADKANMAVKAVTSVKKGYAIGEYENANSITYNTENKDYDVTIQKGKYTITAGPADGGIEVTATPFEGTYDGLEHTFEIDAKGKFADDEFTYYYSTKEQLTAENYSSKGSESKPPFKDAGTYTVYYYVTSSNYSGGKAGSVTVTINKAPLTVTPEEDKELNYGQAISDIPTPALSNFTITGFVGGDDERTGSWTGGSIVYDSSYEKYGDAGTYPIYGKITITETENLFKNYNITYESKVLTVKPVAVTFTWDVNTSVAATGNDIYHMATVVGALNSDDVKVGGYINEENVENGEGRKYAYQAKEAGTYRAQVNKLSGAKACNYYIAENEPTAFSDWEITEGSADRKSVV